MTPLPQNFVDPKPTRTRTSSRAMANRDPWIPASQIADEEPRVFARPQVREYDADADCWVAPPMPMPKFDTGCKRQRVPWPQSRGRQVYQVFDTTTRERLGYVAADTTSQALAIAISWAVASGFDAGDVRVTS